MSGLSTVATALTVVFVVSLAILIGDLLYVLWRRRRFLQRSVAGGDTEIPGDPIYTPSKELLYFFCWKNQSRVEPATAVAPPPLMPEEEEDDDLAKWQVYGSSRVLFTIKEEEKEELESENSLSEENRVCLKDRFEAVVVEVEVEVEVEADEATPFSTPCESPLYYTPSPSPSHDQDTESEMVHGGDHSLETKGFSENEASFVSIQIHGN